MPAAPRRAAGRPAVAPVTRGPAPPRPFHKVINR